MEAIFHDPRILFAMMFSSIVVTVVACRAIVKWVDYRLRAAEDEREERQRLARYEQRHRHRLEKADKLETAAAILIADRSLAEGLRERIDAEYPKVRVEAEQEEELDRDERGRWKSKKRASQ